VLSFRVVTSKAPQELPYDEQIVDLERRLAEARKAASALEAELEWWQRGRELYGPTQESGSVVSRGLEAGDKRPTLALAIFLVMDSGRPEQTAWTAPQVMVALRERGWMPSGKNAEHTVRTKLGQLAKDGSLVRRVRHGVYTLDESANGSLGEQVASGIAGVATGMVAGKLAHDLLKGSA
jgi:hypothetical protein